MSKRKKVKLKGTADDRESLEWFLSQLDHLVSVSSRIIDSTPNGYHVFVTVVVE